MAVSIKHCFLISANTIRKKIVNGANNNGDNTECLAIADEADAFRLTKFKERKRLQKKLNKERDVAGGVSCCSSVRLVTNLLEHKWIRI